MGSGKESREIGRQTFTFRKCYKLTGSQRMSLVYLKDNPGPLKCTKQITDWPFYETWGIVYPHTPEAFGSLEMGKVFAMMSRQRPVTHPPLDRPGIPQSHGWGIFMFLTYCRDF